MHSPTTLLSHSVKKRLSKSALKRSLQYIALFLSRKFLTAIFRKTTVEIEAEIRFFTTHADVVSKALTFVNKRDMAPEEKEAILGSLICEFSIYDLGCTSLSSGEVLIVDEGFCHRAISIWGRGATGARDAGELDEYFARIPVPDILCIVDADEGVCEQRMSRRGYPGLFRKLNWLERREKLSQLSRIINQCAERLTDKGAKVIRVLNIDQEDSSRQISDKVTEMLRTRDVAVSCGKPG